MPQYEIRTKYVIDRAEYEIGVLKEAKKYRIEQDPEQEY